MVEKTAIGVDLNGLQDTAAFDLNRENVVGGAIPSVILATLGKNNNVELVAGAEATGSFEGRGWSWPYESQIDEASNAIRVPVSHVLRGMESQDDFHIMDTLISPANMMASAIESLAKVQATDDGTPITLAIPDDGRFNEDAQQDLLNAVSARGLKVHLLWRSVAAILGMARDGLNPIAGQLDGKEIAVVSCLEDGISVSRLEMNIPREVFGPSYVVPKRRHAGRFFAFETGVLDIANQEAKKVAETLGIEPWQVLWGDGLPLRWTLNTDDQSAIFQTSSGWAKHDGKRPPDHQTIELSEDRITEIDEYIEDVEYMIFEGPALEVPTADLNLVFHLRQKLSDVFESRTGRKRRSLAQEGIDSHLSALGCVEFGQRRANGLETYRDHLPQIRLAVRHNEHAMFKDLIPETAECEGGEEYDELVDLGFSVPAKAGAVEFYLLRDGTLAPRHALEELRVPPSEPVAIRMVVMQRPAQGRARLSIEASNRSQKFPPISVNWDRMEVLSGMSESEIIESLEDEESVVPSVQPHPAHSVLWTYKPNNNLLSFCLKDKIDQLADCIRKNPDSLSENDIKGAREGLLNRFQSPAILTKAWGTASHPDKTKSRAISSDGDFPAPGGGLSTGTLNNFDLVLEHLGNLIELVNSESTMRNQIVTFCTWSFTRCPRSVREHLRSAAARLEFRVGLNDFNAMGRSFSTESELRSFFALLEHDASQRGRLINYHANGLFYILSLREDAPRWMEPGQAQVFVELAMSALEMEIENGKFKGLMRTCLKAIGGLIRYRLVDKTFLSSEEGLGRDVQKITNIIIKRSEKVNGRGGVERIAKDVLSALEKRGAPDTILQWDD